MMRIRLDRAKCVGHGRCYVLAPDVFEDDERGHCVVRKEEVPKEFEEQARRGEQNCPEGAIALVD
ncbi:MAG TPA: ferredoxin [Myxococcota bacterium]|nr:ferredoxin [Myxococcota bacterium]